MKRIVAIFVLATSISIGAIGVADAGPRPAGGCPSAKWELRAAPTGDVSGSPSVDGNGDGLSCYLEAPEGGGISTIVDNTVRTH